MKTIIYMFALLFPLQVCAKDVIATFQIPGLVETADSGLFIDYAKRLIKEKNLNIEIKIIPPKRGLRLFDSQEVVAFYPTASSVMADRERYDTRAFYYKKDYIFYRLDSPVDTLQQLAGKTVGVTLGFNYGTQLDSIDNLTIKKITTDEAGMEMLSRGRLDAYLIEQYSGLTVIRKNASGNLDYNLAKPINSQPIVFSFIKTPKGKALKEIFDSYIAKRPLQIDSRKN